MQNDAEPVPRAFPYVGERWNLCLHSGLLGASSLIVAENSRLCPVASDLTAHRGTRLAASHRARHRNRLKIPERAKGFEPSTPTLARLCSYA